MARITERSLAQIATYAEAVRRRDGPSIFRPPALEPGIFRGIASALAEEAGAASIAETLAANLATIIESRPVIHYEDGRFWTVSELLPAPPDVARAVSLIMIRHDSMARVMESVGRIGVRNSAEWDWLGTAWLVSEDIVVTTRQIAEVFARRGDAGFTFRVGANPTFRQAPYVNFTAKPRAEDLERRAMIERILHIDPLGTTDIALLALRTRHSAPPIGLSFSPPQRDGYVAVAGYPARDRRAEVADLADRLYADRYGRKSLAIGRIVREESGGDLIHDCPVFGDFSGAALLDLGSCTALGLHVSGRFLKDSRAIPAGALAELLRSRPWERPSVVTTGPATGAAGSGTRIRIDIPLEINFQPGPNDVSASIVPTAPSDGAAPPHARPVQPPASVEGPKAPQAPSPAPSQPTIQEAQAPARVLNAHFRDASGKDLKERDPLIAGIDSSLLVDIGPLSSLSLVTGSKVFPETALPQESMGWPIEVVLISDDFESRQTSAWMWVPRGDGPSYPLRGAKPDGDKMFRPESEPGPVELKIRPPKFPESSTDKLRFAHARLCLYYANNLVQSAIVRVAVARSPETRPTRNNSIDVDFVLSAGLEALDERYATRDVRFSRDEPRGQRIALNLTLNDDGAGGHRVIVKRNGSGTPLVGWSRFDPLGAHSFLDRAREKLLECFFLHDRSGEIVRDRDGKPLRGLDARIGKTHEQFRMDLGRLAELGAELFDMAFGQVVRESSSALNEAEWMSELRAALKQGEVIQVARTLSLPAHYVFPWGLIYEYPLPGSPSRFRWCDVLKEWSADGIRRAPPDRECPYADQAWHQQDVLCPYGFWGLKHIVEQPPSASAFGQSQQATTHNQIPIADEVELAVALTRDAELSAASIAAHLNAVGHMKGVRFQPLQPADDYDSVQTMLRSPQLVYFLCHCERDGMSSKAYLSVGERDGDDRHRIYAHTLTRWSSATTGGFDRSAWKSRRPLVFINGCHTADLSPGDLVNFISPFTGAGASGVVGTEVSVQLPVAVEFAEQLLRRFTQRTVDGDQERMPLGEAMREARWHLANKGNLLGLAYTFYSLASLQLVSAAGP